MGTHPIFESDFDCLTEQTKMVDDSDWGAVEASDWGTEIVHAKKVEQVDEEPKKEKKAMVVAKEMKVEKKKMVVETEVAKEEKDVVMQPSKKKSRNKYKTEDGKTLSRVEMMAMKRSVSEGKQEVPETKQEKPKAKKTKRKQTKQKNEGELDEPVLKKKKNEGENEKPVKKQKENVKKEKEPIKKKEKKMKNMEKEMGEEFFGENEVEEAVEIERPTTAREELRARLTKQLKASEFRFLNEKLYRAADSTNVLDPESAQIYHEGFANQVKRWPINPLDLIIKHVRKRVPIKQDVAMRSWRRVCAIQFTRLILLPTMNASPPATF